jgi:hypothetical protein
MNEEEMILQELSEIKADIKDIKKCLYIGNGKPSLCSRLDQVENVTGSLKRLMWIIIGGVATISTSWIALNLFHVKL